MSESLKTKAGLKAGIDVTIGGLTYIAPQLNLGGLRQVVPLFGASNRFELITAVLVHSLNRNYEDVNAAWLNEAMEGSEIDAAEGVTMQVLDASGIRLRSEPGEAQPAAAPATLSEASTDS